MKNLGLLNKLMVEMATKKNGMTHSEMKTRLAALSHWATPDKYPSMFNSKGNYRYSFYENGIQAVKNLCLRTVGFKTGVRYTLRSDVNPRTVKPFSKFL